MYDGELDAVLIVEWMFKNSRAPALHIESEEEYEYWLKSAQESVGMIYFAASAEEEGL